MPATFSCRTRHVEHSVDVGVCHLQKPYLLMIEVEVVISSRVLSLPVPGVNLFNPPQLESFLKYLFVTEVRETIPSRYSGYETIIKSSVLESRVTYRSSLDKVVI